MCSRKYSVNAKKLAMESNSITDNLNNQFNLLNKNLQNTDRTSRQAALQNILTHCQTPAILTESDADHIFNTFYLALLKCYYDRYENCRNLAIEIVTTLLTALPKTSYYIECIVPTVAKRIGRPELIEDSEEIRLLLAQQIVVIVRECRKPDHDLLANVYNDIIDILVKCQRDSFPAIQRECCIIIRALADASPMFHLRTIDLADGLIVMLQHRHSANRIAAIEAIGIVALHIHGHGETVIKLIAAVSPLLMDAMPTVRLECGRVGCRWLLALRDRYSFFERLVPLVLCW